MQTEAAAGAIPVPNSRNLSLGNPAAVSGS